MERDTCWRMANAHRVPSSGLRLVGTLGRGARHWQNDVEACAVARTAFNGYGSANFPDQAVDRAQAKARALTGGLGGKEGFEHVLHDDGRHACPGVAYLQNNI